MRRRSVPNAAERLEITVCHNGGRARTAALLVVVVVVVAFGNDGIEADLGIRFSERDTDEKRKQKKKTEGLYDGGRSTGRPTGGEGALESTTGFNGTRRSTAYRRVGGSCLPERGHDVLRLFRYYYNNIFI